MKRVTQHNGRADRSGNAYSAKHNDRNFDTEDAPNIDSQKSIFNDRWTCQGNIASFDTAEQRFYAKNFKDGLEARNQRYIKQRHPERVQSLEEYRRNPKSCPEEVILQVGTYDNSIDRAELLQMFQEQLAWEKKMYPQAVYLDYALHVDEPNAAPHIHARRVWIGHDSQGNQVVGQNKALREMGVERPHPGKKETRYNNAKQTHTAACREHFQELCRSYGIEIETEPKEPGKSGLELQKLKAKTYMEQAQAAIKQAAEAQSKAQAATAQATKAKSDARDAKELVEVLGKAPYTPQIAQKARKAVFSDNVIISPDDFAILLKRASAGDRLQDKIRGAIEWAARASEEREHAEQEHKAAEQERKAAERIKSGIAYREQAAQLRALTQQIKIAQQKCHDVETRTEALIEKAEDLHADITALAGERDYRQENRYIRWFIDEHEAEFDDFVEKLEKAAVTKRLSR